MTTIRTVILRANALYIGAAGPQECCLISGASTSGPDRKVVFSSRRRMQALASLKPMDSR